MKEHPQIDATKTRAFPVDLGVIASAIICYAGTFLLEIIWQLDIFFIVALGFIISCLTGMMVADIRKSIIFTYVSMVLGALAAAATFLAPYAQFARNTTEFDFAAIAVFTILGKTVLVSLIVYFVGALIGAFVGERATQK